MVLDVSLLTTQLYKGGIKVKVDQVDLSTLNKVKV